MKEKNFLVGFRYARYRSGEMHQGMLIRSKGERKIVGSACATTKLRLRGLLESQASDLGCGFRYLDNINDPEHNKFFETLENEWSQQLGFSPKWLKRRNNKKQ